MKTVDVVQACSKVIDAACQIEQNGYFNFAHENYTAQTDSFRKAMQAATNAFDAFEAGYKALKYKLDNPGQGGVMDIREAASRCKVRGYIQQHPDGGLKLWKNTPMFYEDVECLIHSEPSWKCFDPEGEETSIVG